MRVMITARNVSLTDQHREHIEERVRRFPRFFDQVMEVHVIVSAEKYRQVAEVSVSGKKLAITEKREAPEMMAAVDDVCSRLEVALRRRKDKLKVHRKKNPADMRGGAV